MKIKLDSMKLCFGGGQFSLKGWGNDLAKNSYGT